jgi:hypothetical protein
MVMADYMEKVLRYTGVRRNGEINESDGGVDVLSEEAVAQSKAHIQSLSPRLFFQFIGEIEVNFPAFKRKPRLYFAFSYSKEALKLAQKMSQAPNETLLSFFFSSTTTPNINVYLSGQWTSRASTTLRCHT